MIDLKIKKTYLYKVKKSTDKRTTGFLTGKILISIRNLLVIRIMLRKHVIKCYDI